MKLKKYRIMKGLSQVQLAEILHVAPTTYNNWELGRRDPDHNMTVRIAEALGVSVDELLGVTPKRSVKIPVYARVTAGVPIEALTEIVDYEEIPERMARNGQHIAFLVSGHSMEPYMRDGNVLIVRVQPDVEDGEIAVVTINGDDGVVKKIKKTPTGVTLVSLNPAYEPMYYSNEEITDLPVRVVGRVVECRAKY